MLSASLEADQDEENWRDYVAQNIWAIGKMQLTDPSKYPWPSWTELKHPNDNADNLSGEEIRETLIERWGGGS